MDLNFSSFIILLSFFLFLAMLVKVATRFKLEPNTNLKLPPGPRKLPLIENLHHLISFQLPHQILVALASKYGPIMHLQLGEVTMVVISSVEATKEVMTTHDINFANRPSLIATEILFGKNSDIAVSLYSEYWRQLRKIFIVELLSAKRVQLFRPLGEKEFSNMCESIVSRDGSLINLTEIICLSTCDAVMQISLGNKTDELSTFISIVKETTGLIAGFYMVDMYPSINLLKLSSGMGRRAERLHKIANRILDNIINDCKVANDQFKQWEDLADVLLKFNDSGHELHLTIENIKSVLLDVFIVGIESSSTIMDWTMAEMLRHPRVLKKAQDEVRHIFNEKGFVDEFDFDELNYLKLVIKETLRMHPLAPLLLPKQNSECCEIHGYGILAKTRVMVNVWAIGRDPKYWKDADNFIPERFLDSPIDYKGTHFEYLPFGGGRRVCPGMLFGLTNIELPLAMLLYHFDWVLPNGMKPENLDMTEKFGITATRKSPLYVIPILKKPLLAK